MASSENKRELILTRSPGRLMVSLSLPAIVGMVVIGLYTFVDAIYAGQLIGVDAMGAVSIAYPFTFINSGLAAMIGMGSASVLSRAIGARDQKSIDQVMGNLVVMNLVLSRCSRSRARKAPCSTWGSATCASYSSAACS